MAKICITVPDIDHYSAKQLAEDQGVSMAGFIREAIKVAIRSEYSAAVRHITENGVEVDAEYDENDGGYSIPEASLFSDQATAALKEIAARRQQSVEDYVRRAVEQFERQAAIRSVLDGVDFDPNDGGYAGACPAAQVKDDGE